MVKISNNPETQRLYEEMLAGGTSHKLAEMFALRRGPALSTDTRWQAGFSADPYETVPGPFKEQFAAKARAAGVDPTGKRYNGFLARYPGDPEALVTTRSDIRRVAEKRGIGVKVGPISTRQRAPVVSFPTEGEPYHVSDDIVEREVNREIKQAGETPTPKERAELKKTVAERLAGEP